MLSRQAAKLAKKDLLSISPNLGAFASLRETQFFLIFSLSQNFKYLWLDFKFSITGIRIEQPNPKYLSMSFGVHVAYCPMPVADLLLCTLQDMQTVVAIDDVEEPIAVVEDIIALS